MPDLPSFPSLKELREGHEAKTLMKKAMENCEKFVKKREECYKYSIEGKHGEDCILAELAEKKCLGFSLCVPEAEIFYLLKNGLCSKYAENFAYGSLHPSEAIREEYNASFEKVNKDPKVKKYCRSVVHNLSSCMAPFIKYKETVAKK